ncbi:ABC transporter permease [Mesorhizobium sp. M7A.F.Ca.US.006.01.1.1]|nr:ABC transporter permease [Mesorhizobium sp. M7A.F.Ca.US.006.01.1.1]
MTIVATNGKPMQKPVQKNSESWKPRLDLGSLASVIFFGFLIVAFGVMEPDVFLSADNFASILNNGAVLAILACGLTIVLAVGEFDLSIAASASFAGALSAVMVSQFGLGLTTVIPAVIVTGIVIGIVNGILVTRYEMPALIATIGVSSLLDGLTLWITGNSVIFSGLDDNFLFIGDWRIALLQAPVFYLAVVATVLFVAMRYTTVGRHIYAAGGNRAASRMSGIRVDRQVITAFVVAGVLGSIAGLIYTARQGSLTPLFGTSMLLPTFAAAFLGSVTLARRRFHILGTVIGVYLIETGTTGLLILGAPAYTQQLFAGGVLILATIGARHRAR